jgi:hypothetical protein
MDLLYDIVQNFRFDDPHARALIEMMCALEGALVDSGAIASDFAILAARKKTSALPRSAYARPLPPRTPAARDVEPDPLGFGRRAPRHAKAARRPSRLAPWQLRVLRSVLASSRPRRANLIRERRLNAAIEQARYAISGMSPFDWIRSRWSAHDDDPSVAAMLEAIERVVGRASARRGRASARRTPG